MSIKTIFTGWSLKDEVQGTISRLERDRLQIVLSMIETDAKRVGIENKLQFLKSWLNPPPAPVTVPVQPAETEQPK